MNRMIEVILRKVRKQEVNKGKMIECIWRQKSFQDRSKVGLKNYFDY